MSDSHPPTLTQLQAGELLHGPEDRDTWLSVVRGRIWVTETGDPDDHFLESGQSMRLRAGAKALISAEGGPAQVLLARDGLPSATASPLPQPCGSIAVSP